MILAILRDVFGAYRDCCLVDEPFPDAGSEDEWFAVLLGVAGFGGGLGLIRPLFRMVRQSCENLIGGQTLG